MRAGVLVPEPGPQFQASIVNDVIAVETIDDHMDLAATAGRDADLEEDLRFSGDLRNDRERIQEANLLRGVDRCQAKQQRARQDVVVARAVRADRDRAQTDRTRGLREDDDDLTGVPGADRRSERDGCCRVDRNMLLFDRQNVFVERGHSKSGRIATRIWGTAR